MAAVVRAAAASAVRRRRLPASSSSSSSSSSSFSSSSLAVAGGGGGGGGAALLISSSLARAAGSSLATSAAAAAGRARDTFSRGGDDGATDGATTATVRWRRDGHVHGVAVTHSRPPCTRSVVHTLVGEEAMGGMRRSFSAASAAAAAASAAVPPDLSSSAEEQAGDSASASAASVNGLLPGERYDPQGAVDDIARASRWNQPLDPTRTIDGAGGERGGGGEEGGNANGEEEEKWDPMFVREAVGKYERHLRYVLHRLRTTSSDEEAAGNNVGTEASTAAPSFQSIARRIHPDPLFCHVTERLLSSRTASYAFLALQRTKLDTYVMGTQVRNIERLIGSIGLTTLTDDLSRHLLEANGKAGNVGRALSLLNLRKNRGYPPTEDEFVHAVQSIKSAGLYLRKSRNVFLGEGQQPPIDNPTRWLDAILLNMSGRGMQLDVKLANRMLDCYASTGRTGKAVHFFYRVVGDKVEEDGTYYGPPTTATTQAEGGGDVDAERNREGRKIPRHVYRQMPTQNNAKVKIRMKMRDPPPFHKVPSEVRDKLVHMPHSSDQVTKLEWERDRTWSTTLTAAFAFADSLTHGACGHDPITLDVVSYNALIHACCNRGALWRALQIMDVTMPQHGIEPDVYTYNTILAGLARVGDRATMDDLVTRMTNRDDVPVHAFTVEALVDGRLDMGDIGGAVSVVQDMFNQHDVLPPYTTHLQIIEFALGNGLVYEAKRHVYFIQQLWKWRPNPDVHTNEFRKLMHLTRRNPKLSKKALKRLFAYFGEELTDDDFF